jgi:hypothetical protein
VPLSRDPTKRERQLANLPNLRGEPTSASWRPGAAPHLVHGARGRASWNSPDWSPAVELAIAELERCAGVELKDADGALEPWARPSVEAVAQQLVNMRRGERIAADRDARGRLTLEDVERQARVVDAYHRALEREALTVRSRIEAAGNAARLLGHADLSGMSVEELDALIARLQVKRAIEPPPDALERSRRAARLLAEAGALDVGDGDGDGEPRP